HCEAPHGIRSHHVDARNEETLRRAGDRGDDLDARRARAIYRRREGKVDEGRKGCERKNRLGRVSTNRDARRKPARNRGTSRESDELEPRSIYPASTRAQY